MARSFLTKRAVAFALLPVLVGAGAYAASRQAASEPPRAAIAAADWQPRAGDVILTAADDLLGSQIASASGESAIYSHIGLVVEREGRLAVIEATPMGEGHVGYADLTAFTTDPKVTDLLILRPSVPIDAARLNREAGRLAAAAVPFDFALDMNESERLYCAELVYKLLDDAGLDVRSIPWSDTRIPLQGDRHLVMPDAFSHTPILRPVYRRAG